MIFVKNSYEGTMPFRRFRHISFFVNRSIYGQAVCCVASSGNVDLELFRNILAG
jgi:hypothetical protein